jgi:hypothetical protein
MMDTVTYIMVIMASYEGMQEAVSPTVRSCPIFIQVNVTGRLHFHHHHPPPPKKKRGRERESKADNTEPFLSSQNWSEV